jgi:hypothetical protein
MMIVIVAFACLGFLVGNLVGFSSGGTLAVLIPLLFSFAGGSAVAFLPKLDVDTRRLAAAAVIALSLSCLTGVYSGIFVSERKLLSPANIRGAVFASYAAKPDLEYLKYLRAQESSEIDFIDQKFRRNELTAEQAYEQLYELAKKGGTQ